MDLVRTYRLNIRCRREKKKENIQKTRDCHLGREVKAPQINRLLLKQRTVCVLRIGSPLGGAKTKGKNCQG